MSLLDKLKKNSTVKETAILANSKFFNKKDMITTSVPAINIALSGKLTGGLTPGLTIFAGPSKHFKTSFSLLMAKSYLDKYPDAVLLFYDSEFGTPQAYFASFGIDTARVIHTPITDIEQLKFDCAQQIEGLGRDDRVIIIIDSVGNLASKKEVQDALDGKSVADMTRAKQLKSLFRIVTPHLTIKDIPMIVVNHTYQCGTEDMMVITESGDKSLKDIVVGEKVLTTNGFEPVSYTVTHEDAAVTDIELEDGSVLSFTSGHRFKVDGKWVYVEDLVPGMELDAL
jgi:RecA/RadA recombinase